MSSAIRIGDVAAAIRGITFQASQASIDALPDTVACLTTSAVYEGVRWSTARYIPRALVRNQRQILASGDILVSTANSKATVGRAALVRTVPMEATFGAFVTVLRPGSAVDAEYLALWMRSPEYVEMAYELSSQTTNIANLSVSDLLNMRFPYIELRAQRKVAARLSRELEATDQARPRIYQQLEATRSLRDSALEGTFAALEATDRVPLSRTGLLQDGDWILTADYAPTGVRLFQVGDVGRGRFLARSNRYISLARAGELRCTFLRAGDILISRMADPIGRACIVPKLGYEAITAVDVTIFRPDPRVLDAEYAVLFMNSPSWLRAVAAKASGATRARITRLNLELMEIPLPRVENQRKIAGHLRARLAAIDAIEASIRDQQAAIDLVPRALLRRGFDNAADPTQLVAAIT